MLSSCSSQKKTAVNILKGVIHWVQEDYQEASADFLEAKETAVQQQDETAKVYAQYGIAVSYLMLNEKEAALNQLDKLVGNGVPELVRFGALYNSGIVSYQKGEFQKAADFFKQALLIDNSQLDAKINLELAMSQAEVQSKAAQSELQPVHHSEGSSAQDTIFSMMKENDDKRWKSEPQEKSDILDY
jgi:tetratricopeptide (TPR) repeat protein